MSSEPISWGGQAAHRHTESVSPGGFFHTYDALQVDGYPSRKIHVWLPNDYEHSGESYPVIYMNDGQTAFWAGGLTDKSWSVSQVLSRLWNENRVRKMIIVAIHPHDRDAEYTHAFWMPQHSWGGVLEYSKYVAQHLKPWIDRNYRTLSDRDNTHVVGSSHGGLAAFHVAMVNPNVFGSAFCLSPSFWAGYDAVVFDEPFENCALFHMYHFLLKSPSYPRPRLYVDWGLKDANPDRLAVTVEEITATRTKELAELLVMHYGYEVDKTLFAVEDPEGLHDEASWSRRFEQILLRFFPK